MGWFERFWRRIRRWIERIMMAIRSFLGIPPFRGHSPCAPPYEPDNWNDGGEIQGNNNCYNYGCDTQTGNFSRPGNGRGHPFPSPFNPNTGSGGYGCSDVSEAAVHDGLRSVRREDRKLSGLAQGSK